jgi:hypothetical protein
MRLVMMVMIMAVIIMGFGMVMVITVMCMGRIRTPALMAHEGQEEQTP